MKEIFQAGIDAGAKRICACDTVGILTPEPVSYTHLDVYKRQK